jgi:DNA-binding GntR family transcriptional regulator
VTSLDDAIERPSMREEAMRRIRAAIIYGEIEAGTIHSAPALAARMGVSITPVREALIELANRGMVTLVRNRGFRVVEHTAEDVEAVLELRELVEVPMLARLAGRLGGEELAGFRELVAGGIEAARRGDLGAFLDLDRRFHLGLLRRAGNPQVVAVIDHALDQLRLATAAAPATGPPLLPVAEGHGAIVDAIESGEQTAVRRAVREHLELTRTAWPQTAAPDPAAA